MASRKAPKKSEAEGRVLAVKKAYRCIGQPVCVLLNDGNCYVGTVQAIHNHQLILSETRSCGRVKPSDRSKTPEVQVSGLLDSLIGGIGALNSFGGLFKPMLSGPSGLSGAGVQKQEELQGPSGLGGGQQSGFNGSFKQMLPTFQIGLNVVKSIMPLMGMFKI
ncbi:hypothetical protein DFQ01_10822 [Paenibacillus cellulosilyticus]|uniref:Uncharacterized protein n=1 Tax=Paenibacillus cellulosilyticus TaxID=375489 RepID=A0A2V2YU13_9BACL|nr:hypothetical protein [Paenibacillus cellulosilyticus]PWW02747.1 hypothetical protein DFQ01_10822 [Paenibacillus cellulosilyticus]QKS45672.1 hypothetical protein HUB94_15450 [Paenibacillus cellulosilyticus]